MIGSSSNTSNPPRALACALLLAALAVLPATPAGAGNTEGFVYGKVTSKSGSVYEGRIRWDDEEAFWGDFFNSVKEERKYADEVPRGERERKREPIRIFGITIGVRWDDYEAARAFKARLGDIREIHVRGGDRATVIMKSGSEFEVEGGSNDIGGPIRVWDSGIGEIELPWKKIARIEFAATPSKLKVDAYRLHGTVQTEVGEFRGWIQWDQDECLSTDKLDGDSRDGKLALNMGALRTIERRSGSSSRVTLKDGREFVLEGSNDVNRENRGIFVEDTRFGRVLVSWNVFQRVEFSDAGDSGPSYKSFRPGRSLEGKLTARSGDTYQGRIIYDLDEAETWELFDGEWDDVQYSIPMGMIATVIAETRDSCRLVLFNGEELELEDTADAGDGNAGVRVRGDKDYSVFVPWDDVERIDFKR